MAKFEIAQKLTADCEGGYVNDPKDAGGETIFGIARNIWGKLPLWAIVDEYKKQAGDLATKEARKKLESLCLANAEFVKQKLEFYKQNFWDKCKCDEIESQKVANNVYDFAVNAGTGQSAKVLQRALGVADDGVIGAGTLSACNAKSESELNAAFCDGRAKFYKDLVARKPQNEKFLKGWLSRVEQFR